jgi:hypothetical protein
VSYHDFINRKTQVANDNGFAPLWMPDCLFDFQHSLTEWAIRKGRAAIFADCGLGKSIMQLVWAENVVRKTNKPVLIITPLAVGGQTVREADKFGIAAKQSREGKIESKIVVTNYERLHYFDSSKFAGVVCDESSAIKAFDGKRRKQVTRFLSKMDYRLLCTATAAPNDFIELGTASEALGEMSQSAMLETFFLSSDKKRHSLFKEGDFWNRAKYFFRPYSERPFWQWVCSWARAVRKPSDLGFDDSRFILPELKINQHVIKTEYRFPGELFARIAATLKEQRDERKRSMQDRCEMVASLVKHKKPAVVWCQYNEEGDLLEEMIPDAVQVAGCDSDDVKEERLNAFSIGQIRVLVTKPKIGAWGLNWQHCGNHTFFPSHCYDESTEALTKRGWLTFDQVTLADEVATTNPETLAFEWQHPRDVIWSPYSGPMIHFGSDGNYASSFDLLVTPNHRMFVRRCPVRFPNGDSSWGCITADKLAANYRRQEYRMLSAPRGFLGANTESVTIPNYVPRSRAVTASTNKRGDRRGMHPNSEAARDTAKASVVGSMPTDTFVKLAGWYLSEGYCGARHGQLDGQITITQTDINPDHRLEIIQLLESIPGLSVYSKTKDIRCCSLQLANYLVEQFGAGSHGKRIPHWVKELDVVSLETLRDTMLKGDGCSSKRGGVKRSYRTVSKRLADDFVELCLKTGIRGSAQFRPCTKGRYAGSGIWEVNIARTNLEPSIHCQPVIKDYSGMIGCVSVPNGTVIVRRNGIPVVSGNSFEQFYQAVRRSLRFGRVDPVRVDIIATEGEAGVTANLQKKQRKAEEMFSALVAEMNDSMKVKMPNRHVNKLEVPQWL